MTRKEKQHIISAWNEIGEAHCSLDQLNNKDIISCLGTIKKRLVLAMELIGEHFTDNEALKHIGDPNYRIIK